MPGSPGLQRPLARHYRIVRGRLTGPPSTVPHRGRPRFGRPLGSGTLTPAAPCAVAQHKQPAISALNLRRSASRDSWRCQSWSAGSRRTGQKVLRTGIQAISKVTPRIDHGLGFGARAQHHHQVRYHCRAALVISVEPSNPCGKLMSAISTIETALRQLAARRDHRFGLLAAQQSRRRFSGHRHRWVQGALRQTVIPRHPAVARSKARAVSTRLPRDCRQGDFESSISSIRIGGTDRRAAAASDLGVDEMR